LALELSMERGIAVQSQRHAAVQVTVGPAFYWDKAGWGTFTQEVAHAFATREVANIAGSGEIDTAGAATIAEAMHRASLGVLSGAALMPGCGALELRYVAATPGSAARPPPAVSPPRSSYLMLPAYRTRQTPGDQTQ
jgi:hypothetical protein